MAAQPYKSTPVFDERSLPEAIQNAHNTKDGVWGLLVVLEGAVDLVFHDPARKVHVKPQSPAVIAPQAVHHVELTGPMKMKVEFYREPPMGGAA
ncbi:MAG: DUF1971 domain-containing protein [Novosphingobium sp.]|uniref:DUF1971 domain-containing protein n=1 Tax=Novosphingobium sp. TaxID=1874826 RepID=UPI002601C230|nr:DUF1971 domain-containing protein [Novosphingobium sp.]MCP5386771.1 DUF1971 domain-containing protein [Novosphingobium sp.]